MIAWSKISEQWSSYASRLKPLWENGTIDKIYTQLKIDGKELGEITPAPHQVWRFLQETPINKLRCVIVNDKPYNTKIGERLVADGLALGASNHAEDKEPYLPEELIRWVKAVELEMENGLCMTCINDGWVPYFLAKEGVLMLNLSLTTIVGKDDPHRQLWAPFQDYFFEYIIAPARVPVITLGEEVFKYVNNRISSELIYNLPSLTNPDFAMNGLLKILQKSSKDTTGYEIDFSLSLPF